MNEIAGLMNWFSVFFSQKAGSMNFMTETLIEYIHKTFYT